MQFVVVERPACHRHAIGVCGWWCGSAVIDGVGRWCGLVVSVELLLQDVFATKFVMCELQIANYCLFLLVNC